MMDPPLQQKLDAGTKKFTTEVYKKIKSVRRVRRRKRTKRTSREWLTHIIT